jgi:hypothetical protein
VSVLSGHGYFPLDSDYKEYLAKVPIMQEVSPTASHVVIADPKSVSYLEVNMYISGCGKQDKRKSKNMDI